MARATAASVLFGLATLLALGDDPGRLQINFFRLINDLPNAAGPPLLGIMQLGALAAVGVTAVVALLGRRLRLAQVLLLSGGLAWGLAKLSQAAVHESPPDVVLTGVHLHGAVTPGHSFPTSHAAVAAALATAASPYVSRRTRHLLWALVFVVGLARVYNGAHFPLDVVGGLALGWGVGSLVHVVLGRPRGAPSPEWVAHVVAAAGHPVEGIRRIVSTEVAASAYFATALDGRALHITYFGKDLPEGDWLYHAWRILAFRDVEDEAAASTPGHRVAREACLTLLAERAHVSVAPVVGIIEAGSGALVLRSWVPGAPLLPGRSRAGSDVVKRVWTELAGLHSAGLSHGALRGDHIIIGDDRPVLTAFGLGRDGSSQLERANDIAELLVTVALVGDCASAVRDAAEALGTEAVARALPSLQPLALSAVSRRRLRAAPGLLDELRKEVADLTAATAPPVEPRTRVAVRNLLPLVVLGAAIYVFLPQVARAGATARALGAFQWIWLPAIIGCAFATYVSASAALIAAVGRPLAIGRTTGAQLAAAFTNRLAPAGLGAMATEVRYLQASGVPRGDAIAAVGLKSVVGAAVHAVGLAALIVVATSNHVHFGFHAPGIPERWELLVFIAVGLAMVGLLVGGLRFRRVWLPPIRQVYGTLRVLRADPMRALRLAGASAGITAAYALALVAAVEAAGGGPVVAVLAVYLGASAVAAAAPTPGGLGAVEAGLVAGLTAAGIHTGEAITAVLVFRIVTYWGPVLPGAASFWLLRRAGAL